MIRIGSRGSRLALWQAEHVQTRLAALGHESLIQVITTTGDLLQDRRLESIGGKGFFLKEIEEALIANQVDLAVHSLKDVPTILPHGLHLCAYLERADPRDALLSSGPRLSELPPGARLGTTSLRRQVQVLSLRPDCRILDLRGNVDTRIRRLRQGDYDAILLAMAGLSRLGRADEVTELLEITTFLPAPGQGVIALECRAKDHHITSLMASLNHTPTAHAVASERAFLMALGGSCNVPLGAYAEIQGDRLHLLAMVASVDGRVSIRGERSGDDPSDVGQALADEFLTRGARALLNR